MNTGISHPEEGSGISSLADASSLGSSSCSVVQGSTLKLTEMYSPSLDQPITSGCQAVNTMMDYILQLDGQLLYLVRYTHQIDSCKRIQLLNPCHTAACESLAQAKAMF